MIVAFLVGTAVEFAWLFWIYCAARGWPARTAVSSMAIGAFSLLGIRAGFSDTSSAVALIFGYGVGSYLAALAKRKWGVS